MVYGIGISGCGAAESLLHAKKKVFLYNDVECKVDGDLQKAVEASGGSVIFGNGEKLLADIDTLVLSPGVPLTNGIVQKALAMNIEVIGEAELAYNNFKGRLIGITGTNGKTTTTTIVGEMAKKLACVTKVGGNIGVSLSKEVEDMPEDSWLVAELSSYQLETVKNFKTDIAVVLNLTPDHLVRHGTMEAYGEAKRNVFARQTEKDITILNYDDATVKEWSAFTKGKVCYFSRKTVLEQGVYIDNDEFVISWGDSRQVVCHKNDLKIFGSHNEENVLAAIAAGFFAGVAVEDMREVLLNFQGVEHRLEYVTTIDRVRYFNDSKGTNPDSTIKALEAFSGNVILIAGGRDKLTDISAMMNLVREKCDLLILLGEAAERFRTEAEKAGVGNIVLVSSMEQAVKTAAANAKEPQVVLLSPACASFDMFKDYPERGRIFKEYVLDLRKQ